jgi:hypothetical protein
MTLTMVGAPRRVLELSSRSVAAGGESGPWRWLLSALVIGVILLAGQQIAAMNKGGERALDKSLEAHDLSAQLAELGSLVSTSATATATSGAAARARGRAHPRRPVAADRDRAAARRPPGGGAAAALVAARGHHDRRPQPRDRLLA